MATKMRYTRTIKPKNAKRKIEANAKIEVQNGQTKLVVDKSIKNVKNGKTRK